MDIKRCLVFSLFVCIMKARGKKEYEGLFQPTFCEGIAQNDLDDE